MSRKRSANFLYNCWYVAGWSRELARGEGMARRILSEPIVLFRTEGGVVAALEDRCCHRALPLSFGQVDGERLRCSYHGLEFGASGKCERIPAQEKIPSTACVRCYPLVEQDELLWIWMGDEAKADSRLIPRHPEHEDQRFEWRSASFEILGNWKLMVENLMDLSHLPYIHANTIGGNPELHFSTKTQAQKLENGVAVIRQMPSSVPPPTYVAAKGFTGLVDRWQEIEFRPVRIRIHTGACDVGTGAYEGKREHGLSMIGFHGITPETEMTTHYFWSMSTNVLVDGIPDLVFQQTADTFREDQVVIELQQRRIAEEPDRQMVDIASDAGSRLATQLIRRLLREEHEETVPA